MTNDITTTASQAHVEGFVTSYAKCWEHYEGYMQDPSKSDDDFKAECFANAQKRGIDIKLPAASTFRNKRAKLQQAGVIPERLKSDNPEAVKSRKRREGSNAQIGQMTPTDDSQSSTTHSLPENSDESSSECNSNSPSTPSVVGSPLRQSDGGQSEFKSVSALPQGLDSYSEKRDTEPLSVDTTAYSPNDAVEQDLNECRELLARLREITRKHCDVTTPSIDRFSEQDWEELDQEFGLLQGIASMRWQKLREQVQQETRAVARELTKQIASAAGYSDAEVRGFLR